MPLFTSIIVVDKLFGGFEVTQIVDLKWTTQKIKIVAYCVYVGT